MKTKKHTPESLPEIPAKPSRDVPKTDRERAENEGMTLKPNRDPMNHEGMKIDKTKADSPPPTGAKAATPQTGGPKIEGVEGEGSYSASRRYREGLEKSVKQGDSDELAQRAADALDSPEGGALREAEERGKHGKTPHSPAAAAPKTATPARKSAPTRGRDQQPVSHR